MGEDPKFAAIKDLEVFQGLPHEKLGELARLLDPVTIGAGQVIVEEGSVGDCMFIIYSGKVRIEKKVSAESNAPAKELATLGEGDFFGEMALVEDQVRSARVVAATDAELYRLDRDSLFAWIEHQPQMTAAFFKTLVRTLSHRLRTTSRELTMLYELANLFLQGHPTERALLNEVVTNIVHYFEGSWTAAGYIYNEFNDEYELTDAEGAEAELIKPMPAPTQVDVGWKDDKSLVIALPGERRPMGFLLLVTNKPLKPRAQEEVSRIAQTVARLVVSAILNVRHATEEVLRTRLKAVSM